MDCDGNLKIVFDFESDCVFDPDAEDGVSLSCDADDIPLAGEASGEEPQDHEKDIVGKDNLL